MQIIACSIKQNQNDRDMTSTCWLQWSVHWVFEPNHSTWPGWLSRSWLALIHAFTLSRQRANQSAATEESYNRAERTDLIWHSSTYWCRQSLWLATTSPISAVYKTNIRCYRLTPADAKLYRLCARHCWPSHTTCRVLRCSDDDVEHPLDHSLLLRV